MTTAQRNDIEATRYFIPSDYRHIIVTDTNEQSYLEWSEKGLHKDVAQGKFTNPTNGFEALVLGKTRRGLHVDLWEQGVLEGTFPYINLFEPTLPEAVAQFMSREMFKGRDRELIMAVYRGV